jgi:chromosome segregation ATPase
MTLGTNATVAELIKYAPQELDLEALLKDLEELEGFRALLDLYEETPEHLGIRIEFLDKDLTQKEEDIENLETELEEQRLEIAHLESRIEELEAELADEGNT